MLEDQIIASLQILQLAGHHFDGCGQLLGGQPSHNQHHGCCIHSYIEYTILLTPISSLRSPLSTNVEKLKFLNTTKQLSVPTGYVPYIHVPREELIPGYRRLSFCEYPITFSVDYEGFSFVWEPRDSINNQYRMSEVAIICGGIAMQISYRVTGDRNEYNL